MTNGAFHAGVEIKLPPGAHTYWKNPGEAGVPPVFSFDGSRNVAAATVEFPAPKRISEEGLDAFGYDGTVVFPVFVRPRDGGQPVVLHADVSYAVCGKICVPEQGTADLALPSGAADGAAVAMALTQVPKKATPAQTAALRITQLPGTSKPTWLVSWGASPAPSDIFCTAPDGYVFTTRPRGQGTWALTAASVVAAPRTGKVPVELTVVAAGGPIVVSEMMDVSSAAH